MKKNKGKPLLKWEYIKESDEEGKEFLVMMIEDLMKNCGYDYIRCRKELAKYYGVDKREIARMLKGTKFENNIVAIIDKKEISKGTYAVSTYCILSKMIKRILEQYPELNIIEASMMLIHYYSSQLGCDAYYYAEDEMERVVNDIGAAIRYILKSTPRSIMKERWEEFINQEGSLWFYMNRMKHSNFGVNENINKMGSDTMYSIRNRKLWSVKMYMNDRGTGIR